jgi:hypothetical protein
MLRHAGLLASLAVTQATHRTPDLWRGGYAKSESGEIGGVADAPAAVQPPGPPPTGSLKQTGASVDVWAAVETLRRCGHIDVPDIPARAYQDAKGLTHMIVGSTGYNRMNGKPISTPTPLRPCSHRCS